MIMHVVASSGSLNTCHSRLTLVVKDKDKLLKEVQTQNTELAGKNVLLRVCNAMI